MTRAPPSGSIVLMRTAAPPTFRQMWALVAALCERAGEDFARDRASASALIERLRLELGHPEPRLEDVSLRRRLRNGRGGTAKLARAIAAEVARELR
jgi:hypothetical protein